MNCSRCGRHIHVCGKIRSLRNYPKGVFARKNTGPMYCGECRESIRSADKK